ncbi:hypothetical protein GCM10008949_53280 [Deinococcus humi]|nr:hypothetical protein GCM10008949_53280 [Deinococcus humi]
MSAGVLLADFSIPKGNRTAQDGPHARPIVFGTGAVKKKRDMALGDSLPPPEAPRTHRDRISPLVATQIQSGQPKTLTSSRFRVVLAILAHNLTLTR